MEIPARPKFDKAKITTKVEQLGKIGSTEDPRTAHTVRQPLEQALYDDARRDTELIANVLNGRFYDNDFVPEEARNHVRNMVFDTIMQNPVLAREYHSLTTRDAKQKFLDRHITDPRFMAEVRKSMEALANSPDFPNAFDDATDNLLERNLEREAVEAEIAEIDRRIRTIETRLSDFERTGAHGRMGRKARDLENNRTELAAARREVAGLVGTKEAALARVQSLRGERTLANTRGYAGRPPAEIQLELIEAEEALRQADVALKTKEAEIAGLDKATIPGLEQEEAGLEHQMDTLRKDRAAKQKELNKIMVDVRRGERSVKDARRAREVIEQDFAERLKAVWRDAATTVINEDLGQLADGWRAAKDKEEAELTHVASKAGVATIKRALDKKIETRGWRGKRVRTVIDKRKTQELTASIIDKGPEAVAESILRASINPETGLKFTDHEVEVLLKNKEFMAEFQPTMIKEVFGRKLLSSGGFNEEDARAIVVSDWGGQMIQAAAQRNEDLKNKIEEVMGVGALSKPGFAKRLAIEATKPKNVGLLALLGLLALPVGGVVGAGAVAGAVAGKAGFGAYTSGKGYSPVFG
jgi:uncharacterized protein YoxC